MTEHTETNSAMHPLSETPTSSTIAETGNNASRKRVKKMGNTNGESSNIERERRSKMSQMFTQLRTTVPGVFLQATREVILNETISYIKELEKKKQRLEELKESMKLKRVEGNSMVASNCSITVTVSSNVAFFGIQSMPRPSLITIVLKVFCKHQAEVLAANVSVNDGKLILAITALVQNGADGNGVIENIKRDIMNL